MKTKNAPRCTERLRTFLDTDNQTAGYVTAANVRFVVVSGRGAERWFKKDHTVAERTSWFATPRTAEPYNVNA